MNKVWKSNMNTRFSRTNIAMFANVHPSYVMCKYCKHKDTCEKLKNDIHTTETSYCNNYEAGKDAKW